MLCLGKQKHHGAGKEEGMTAQALDACAAGKMWEVYEPTPMTREWLEENNYIAK